MSGFWKENGPRRARMGQNWYSVSVPSVGFHHQGEEPQSCVSEIFERLPGKSHDHRYVRLA
jgi:hypothetical protein